MGLLDKLWDDTLAGNRPETDISPLRKYSSLPFRQSNARKVHLGADGVPAKAASAVEGRGSSRSPGGVEEAEPKVTRSIMIKRPAGWSSPSNGTPPASPAGSTPSISPFSGSGSGIRSRRKSSSDAYERRSDQEVAKDWSSSYPPFEV